jgi:hypothetical protein
MTVALTEHAAKAIIAALLGAGLGWGANALTLSGRVAAIEAALVRIESRLYVAPTPAPVAQK